MTLKQRTLPFLALAALLIPMSLACDNTSQSPTPVPLASGGLGLTRAAWEQKHTFILAIPGSDYIYDGFNQPLFGYRVNFWQQEAGDDPTARISAISVDTRLVLSDTGGIPASGAGTATLTKAQMQEAVRDLIPADAALQSTEISSVTGTFTQTYRSNLLKNVYPALSTLKDPWGDQPPGTFRVAFEGGGPSVLIIAGKGAQSTGSPLEILPTKSPSR